MHEVPLFRWWPSTKFFILLSAEAIESGYALNFINFCLLCCTIKNVKIYHSAHCIIESISMKTIGYKS
jgi:hypothetical protein